MTRQAYIRCDASKEIGVGHVMRCLTLADLMTERGWKCTFMCSETTSDMVPKLRDGPHLIAPINTIPDQVDLLIVDHYGLDLKYEKAARKWAKRILVIDDLANRAHDCDILLDQTYGRLPEDYKDLVPQDCRILTGSRYALLRPQFAELRAEALAKRKAKSGPCQNLLISLGGTNIGNVTTLALKALEDISQPLHVKVVLGKNPLFLGDVVNAVEMLNKTTPHKVECLQDVSDMASLTLWADLAIGAGGTTSWERRCLGLSTLLIEVADNQRKVARELDENGAVKNLGYFKALTPYKIAQGLKALISNDQLKTMSDKAFKVVDGRGVSHVLPHLLEPVTVKDNNQVSLRTFQADDAKTVFNWQILPETRKYFRNPTPPTWSEHTLWFDALLNNPMRQGYIILNNDIPAGVVRLDQLKADENKFEVSILLSPKYYQTGTASAALKLVQDLYSGATIHAEVNKNNIASQKMFTRAGFKPSESNSYIYCAEAR